MFFGLGLAASLGSAFFAVGIVPHKKSELNESIIPNRARKLKLISIVPVATLPHRCKKEVISFLSNRRPPF